MFTQHQLINLYLLIAQKNCKYDLLKEKKKNAGEQGEQKCLYGEKLTSIEGLPTCPCHLPSWVTLLAGSPP